MSTSVAHGRGAFIEPDIDQYCRVHSTPPDALAVELRQVTEAHTGPAAGMQIGDDQARLMEMIVRAMSVTRALEVGTFTGYSALAIARGLASGGRLICCDVSMEWTAIAREFWAKAGVANRVDLRIGPALDTLREMSLDEQFDVAFIDADKANYPLYFEEVLARVRPGGLIMLDNTLQGGRVLDRATESEDVAAIQRLNDTLVADPRVVVVQLPLGDGVTCVNKL